MKYKGFKIPTKLEAILEIGQPIFLSLKADIDHWGEVLETELGPFFEFPEEFDQNYSRLPIDFADNETGFENGLETIDDFAMVIPFAMAGDGAPFCLDYREKEMPPKVIWWEDIGWRLIAPTFEDFLQLFDLSNIKW